MARPETPALVAALAAASLALAGCATDGATSSAAPAETVAPVATASIHAIPEQSETFWSWWDQEIVFYPRQNVYYAPHASEYYWYRDGVWQAGSALPRDIRPGTANPQLVKRGRLLVASGNAPEILALNPHYAPAAPLAAPALRFAEAPADNDATNDAAEAVAEASNDANDANNGANDAAEAVTLVDENE